ncbi:MAG: mannonate dehydratase [Microlunatus sp.]|nr:mannonate dehydratase [Microlunatus sp.]
MEMRVALGQYPRPSDDYLTFAKQLGVSGVQFNTPELPGQARWDSVDLKALVAKVGEFGLTVEAIENLPTSFFDKVMLGRPGSEEQLAHVRSTIESIGHAGIPILGLCFMPQSVWRTGLGPHGRGGAVTSSYDHVIASDPARLDEVWEARRDQRRSDVKDSWVLGSHAISGVRLTEAEMWANFTHFVRAIAPTAEDAGVTIAFHPDDPPVPELDGIPRILRSVDALERAMSIIDSPAIGLDLCLGTVSEMGGADAVLDAIDRFGPEGKIIYVHMRDVQGQVPTFTECFLGEGNYSPLEAVRRLHRVGFRGFILDDHTPGLTGDDGYGYRGHAHATGYLQALVAAVQDEQHVG